MQSGMLKKDRFYTIRKGELINDIVQEGKTIVSTQELIKVREREDGSGHCGYYDDVKKTCTVYENRPSQCVALKCWDTKEFLSVYARQKLSRKDVVQDNVLMGVVEEHEKRCSYSVLEEWVKKIETEGERAIEKILGILKFDYQIRPFITEKLGLNPDEMNLYFGRPIIETIGMFGLKVEREADGSFLLTIDR